MIGIQLTLVALAILAIHLTHLYYKRRHFSKRELILWGVLWCSFIGLAIFPSAIAPAAAYLGLTRPMDFAMIGAFVVLFSLAFHTYVMGRKHDRDLERLVRAFALRDIPRTPPENSL